jgi:hypothetical protein
MRLAFVVSGRLATTFLLVSLMAGLFGVTASAQVSSRGPDTGVQAPIIPPNAKQIVIKGEQVCLRRLPDENGRVLLSCAIGLRGDDDRFYGMRAADPTRIIPFPEMNARVRVTGHLIPGSGGDHVEAGQIIYASIEPIADAKPATGTLMCILPPAAGAPPVDNCRNVIKTDGGLYWGLDMRTLEALPAARGLAAGDRISLEGDLVHRIPEDWHPWMFPSDTVGMEGVLKVRTLKKLTPR